MDARKRVGGTHGRTMAGDGQTDARGKLERPHERDQRRRRNVEKEGKIKQMI